MGSGGQGGRRAGQRGGSSSVTLGQAPGQAATATATPQRPRRQLVTAALSRAQGQQPPHPRRSKQPIGRSATAHRTPIGCDCCSGSAPPAGPGLTDRPGQAVERVRGRGGSRGRGMAWRAVRRFARVKPKWPPQVRGGGGARRPLGKGAGNNGERVSGGGES